MKTTIFGVLLDVTPEQDTILRRLMRKYGFMLRFAFNAWLQASGTSAPWNASWPRTRRCPYAMRKMRCRRPKTSSARAIKPCKTASLYGHSASKRRANG